MKKFIYSFFLLILILALVSCNSTDGNVLGGSHDSSSESIQSDTANQETQPQKNTETKPIESNPSTNPKDESSGTTTQIKQLLPSVKNVSHSDMYSAWSSNNLVSFKQNVNDFLEGKTVTRIGIPVISVSDYTKDCSTQIHLVTTTVPATVIQSYTVTIPANTYKSNSVNRWIYLEEEIKIGDGQALAFGTEDETVFWGYADSTRDAVDQTLRESRGCMINVDTSPSPLDHSLLFDISFKEEKEQNMNSLKGKYISILGASTSTFDAFSNCSMYNSTIGYNANYYTTSQLQSVNDTWWMKTINELDMKLCVNNSWSGSCVTTMVDGTNKAGCMDRVLQLHNDKLGIDPDIIVLIIGGNDALRGFDIGSYQGVEDIYDAESKQYVGDCTLFAQAYATMVHKAQARYPDADIYVCSMLHWQTNSDLPQYNNVIKEIAEEFQVTYVDFYNGTSIAPETKSTYLFSDSIHPNKDGFAQMSNCIVNALKEKYE